MYDGSGFSPPNSICFVKRTLACVLFVCALFDFNLCLSRRRSEMSYDDVEIEDMEWSEELTAFTYPCPCGDLFQITKEELRSGEEIARCPSCSLYITVIYNPEDFAADRDPPKQPLPQPVAVA